MYTKKVKLEVLKEAINTVPKMKETLEILSVKARGRRNTSYFRLRQLFNKEKRMGLTRNEFHILCDTFQKAGIGRLFLGDGTNPKFIWSYNYTSACSIALGRPDPRPKKTKEGNIIPGIRKVASTNPLPKVLEESELAPEIINSTILIDEIKPLVSELIRIRRNGFEFELNLKNLSPDSCKTVTEIMKLVSN